MNAAAEMPRLGRQRPFIADRFREQATEDHQRTMNSQCQCHSPYGISLDSLKLRDAIQFISIEELPLSGCMVPGCMVLDFPLLSHGVAAGIPKTELKTPLLRLDA